jgi:antitoxin VapB
MAFSIKDPEADRLVRELARQRGWTLSQAVKQSVLRELREGGHDRAITRKGLAAQLLAIAADLQPLPSAEQLSEDEILGFDAFGAPTR